MEVINNNDKDKSCKWRFFLGECRGEGKNTQASGNGLDILKAHVLFS